MLNRILSSKEKINTSNKRLCKVLSALILVLSLVLSLAGCSGADIADSINPSQMRVQLYRLIRQVAVIPPIRIIPR